MRWPRPSHWTGVATPKVQITAYKRASMMDSEFCVVSVSNFSSSAKADADHLCKESIAPASSLPMRATWSLMEVKAPVALDATQFSRSPKAS
eukprot:788713-Pyramimonas_sp.AAC.1